MPISMAALFSPPPPTHLQPSLSHKPQFTLKSIPLFTKPSSNHLLLLSPPKASAENGAGISTSSSSPAAVEEPKPVTAVSEPSAETKKEESLGSNGAVADEEIKFLDPRWIGGTWDLNQFLKDGATDWDGVIDAEVRRRKWLETNPESSNNNEPVVFDTAIIPWWAWMKRFHLPEAELLNGRAAMVGFFMAYFVDSLTGVGLVDQMGNFFCKTLLLISVLGVLLIRKNEDVDKIKKLIEESNFYDKQWQATWKDDTTSKSE